MEHKYRTLVIVGFGVFMAVADSSIIALAIPAIARDFSASVAQVSWVFISYLITIVALLVTLGRLADIHGRKRVYLASFWVFVAGSLLCGLSTSLPLLLAMRVLQGIGASGMITNAAAVLVEAFPAKERGRALGSIAIFVAGASMAGPPLGGFLVEYVSWHWVFFINVPVGVGAALLGQRWLRESETRPGQRFDHVGAALLASTLVLGMFALTFGVDFGWTDPRVLASAVGGVLLLVLLLAYERRAPQPVLDLSLFRSRSFALGNASGIFSFIALFGILFLMPVYATAVRGLGPGETGLMMMSATIALPLLGPVSGHLSDEYGSRWLCVAGMVVIGASTLSLATIGLGTPTWEIAARLALFGVGMAVFQSPNNSAILGSVPPQKLGVGSGMMTTVRNIGIALGTALPATFLGLLYAAGTGGPPSLDAGATIDRAAFLSALQGTYFLLGGACLVAAGIAAMRE